MSSIYEKKRKKRSLKKRSKAALIDYNGKGKRKAFEVVIELEDEVDIQGNAKLDDENDSEDEEYVANSDDDSDD
ncbi:hypothetical protein L195_g039464 [Trifolium pratense]|uniref:Uncharacterized protein n=1 Tax=Trifolium pratense TaxID=57577 RepID=A0A2K3LY25_TRIPR|nr:hypothetical protein L195_g039464 [Trifolium pratense]